MLCARVPSIIVLPEPQLIILPPPLCPRTSRISLSRKSEKRILLSCLESIDIQSPASKNLSSTVVRQSKLVFTRTTMSETHEHAQERAILILYATETGNSLDAAERIAREVRRWHFHTRLASTDAYPLVSWIPKDISSEFYPPRCPRKT